MRLTSDDLGLLGAWLLGPTTLRIARVLGARTAIRIPRDEVEAIRRLESAWAYLWRDS